MSRILLADDEGTFLQTTADLLSQEGYHCDCVSDASRAVQMLSDNEYDLLITDIEMAGNSELEFIREMPNIAAGVPVILVTDQPSLRSAIQSVKLQVEAYLVKPVDFEELLEHVHISVEHFQVYRSVRSIKHRFQHCHEGMCDIEELLKHKNTKTFSMSYDSFLELTFQNIVASLSDLKHLAGFLAMHNGRKKPCHLLNCPTLQSLTGGLERTIEHLENSKSAFKSKDLGKARRELEELVSKA